MNAVIRKCHRHNWSENDRSHYRFAQLIIFHRLFGTVALTATVSDFLLQLLLFELCLRWIALERRDISRQLFYSRDLLGRIDN
jgi:hypothetical protein